MLYKIELNDEEIKTLKSILEDRKEILERIENNKKLSLNKQSRLNEIKNILSRINEIAYKNLITYISNH